MNIHIIGAGIGGLTTAIALQKKGFNVTIFETTPELLAVGAGIIIANNAMQIYKKLGLEKRIQEKGIPIHEVHLTDGQLNVISSANLKQYEEKYDTYNIAIKRAELHAILTEEVELENIKLNKRVAHIQSAERSVNIRFTDGKETNADIIIGADGIHSMTRSFLFGNCRLRDALQPCWRGIATISLDDKNTANEAWHFGKRFGFVAVNDTQVYWYALVNKKEKEISLNKSELMEQFNGFHPNIKNIIEKTTDDKIIRNDIFDLEPIQNWHKGRICLLGDAAHATTPNMGQGACQAIEDAYVLAECLAKYPDYSKAFSQYETLRKPKAHFVVNTSWTFGKIAHWENKIACKFRNLSMKLMPASSQQKQFEKLFDVDYGI